MAGNKPELKISAKDKDGGERVSLFAFWRNDNGKLSGSLDSRIKGMRVFLEDGGHVDVKRRDDGKGTHWIDCFEESGDTPAQSRGNGGGRRREEPPPDDFDSFGPDDDGIPFAKVDGRLP